MGDIFGVLKFQILLGVLEFLIFLFGGGVNGRCLARAYVRRKTESIPWDTHAALLRHILFAY